MSIHMRGGSTILELINDTKLSHDKIRRAIQPYIQSSEIEYNAQSRKFYLRTDVWKYWNNAGVPSKFPMERRSMWLNQSPVQDWWPIDDLPRPSYVYYIGPYKEPYLTLYRDMIKPTVKSLGLSCMTAIEDPGSEEFLRRKILPALKNARFVLCDLSESNVNVHYELGWLHAFGTPFYAFTMKDRATDIRHLTIDGYELTERSLSNLQKKIIESLEKNGISVLYDEDVKFDYSSLVNEL